jgi:transcriptional regulator with XRE-family HTH domain
MPDKFGALLRKLRRAADKTLGEIAEIAGVSIVYLSDVERSNRSAFSTDRILKIAVYLSVDPLPLIEAADRERGVIEYDITSAAPLQAGVVGDLVAGLQRGGVTDDQLRRIQEILGSEAKNG